MPISFRKIVGLVLIGAAYWVLRGRVAAMSFEVKVGNSWAGVLTDVTYLIPGIGAFLALAGGVAVTLGRSGKTLSVLGTLLVLLFAGLVYAMSGNFDLAAPFLWPVIVMLGATLAIIFTKPE